MTDHIPRRKAGKMNRRVAHHCMGTAASVRSSDADAGVELRCKPSSWGLIRYRGGKLGTLKQPWEGLWGGRVEEGREDEGSLAGQCGPCRVWVFANLVGNAATVVSR